MELITQLAALFETTPDELVAAFKVGARQRRLDNLFKLIQFAKQVDAQITTIEQALIDAVVLPIMEKRSARTNYVAGLEAHWNESKQSPDSEVTVPSESDVTEFMNAHSGANGE